MSKTSKLVDLALDAKPNMAGLLAHVGLGDAIGEPLEFESSSLSPRFNQSVGRDLLHVSDDTQMSLFMAEALGAQSGSVDSNLRKAYIRWYMTQIQRHPPVDAEGLSVFHELYHRMAPGHTCIQSSYAMYCGELRGVNNSKGNGSVMRLAPLVLWAYRNKMPETLVMDLAEMDTKLTHSHPAATASARFLAGVCYKLLSGLLLREAVTKTLPSFRLHTMDSSDPGCRDCLDSLGSGFGVYQEGQHLSSGGWTADEAVVLAVQAVLTTESYLDAIHEAATIQGDSDTVAAIAGALAYFSGRRAPGPLIGKLDVIAPILYVADLHI